MRRRARCARCSERAASSAEGARSTAWRMRGRVSRAWSPSAEGSTGTSRQRTTRSRSRPQASSTAAQTSPGDRLSQMNSMRRPSCDASPNVAPTRVRDEPARDREQHARAVAGLFVRGERAAVTQLREALQPELHHSAVGATRDVCHESDPARVPLERPVGPGTSARGEPSVGRRHGSPPRLRSERTPYVAGVSSPFRPYERCVTTAGVLGRREPPAERHTAVTRGTSLRNCDSLRSPESATGCHRTRHGT